MIFGFVTSNIGTSLDFPMIYVISIEEGKTTKEGFVYDHII